jgi:hypothetical protein
MAISYPVDVANTRWSVIQVSTGEIVGRNRIWPVGDGSEIPGLDEDFVYLKQVAATPPDYDSRVYTLNSTEVPDIPNNELRTTFTTVKRPLEELLIVAENVETLELQKHIRLEREAIETRLMVGALLKFVLDLEAMPPKVRTMADRYKAKAVKLFKNRDRIEEIKTDFTEGREPDLDSGFESAD